MSLPTPTVGKFLRENFSGKNPIVVKCEEREQWMDAIKSRLTGFSNVDYTDKPRYRASSVAEDRYLGGMYIYNPQAEHRSYWESNSFNFELDYQDQLRIGTGSLGQNSALISDLDELVNFVLACNERLNSRAAKSNKRQKVRQLKSHAMIAQIKNLAKEEKFDYDIKTDSVKVTLFVKLSEAECLELHIPFTRFQEILPKLKEVIQAAKALYEQDIKLKIRKQSWRQNWTNHEDL